MIEWGSTKNKEQSINKEDFEKWVLDLHPEILKIFHKLFR